MAISLDDKLARLPGDRRATVDARAAELIAEMTLRDLRRALARTQVHLARELRVKQETALSKHRHLDPSSAVFVAGAPLLIRADLVGSSENASRCACKL
jgi:hypothetical protein